MARHIVIVGGGAAGLALATRLGRGHGRAADVTLIDREHSHVWKPRLHAVAAGTFDAALGQVGFLAHASRNGFRYVPGELAALDASGREIILSPVLDAEGSILLDERRVRYDVLVLAVGSTADDFGIPGVREHCHFIDSRAQAERFNAALRAATLQCLADDSRHTLDIGIVGGGATGVELAAEIATALDLAAGYGLPGLRDRLRLSVVEAAPRLLPPLPEELAHAAHRGLERLGVRVVTGASVSEVKEDRLVLEGGEPVPATLSVWAAGIRAPEAAAQLEGVEHARGGRIVIRPTLQSSVDDDIFVLGDCAWLAPPGSDDALPATAQVAQQQSRHLARAMRGHLAGRALPAFSHTPRGALVTLGHYDAYGSLANSGTLRNGLFVRGTLAQFSYGLLYRRQQATLHGLPRTMLYWLVDALTAAARPRVRLA